jgi:CheY-like chemotaxis protein
MMRTVVIVDDDPETLDFLEMLLSSWDYRVVPCGAFSEATERIRQVKPDVVVLDLQERSDRWAGLRVLEQLRADEMTAQLPVLVMSADHLVLDGYAARFRELGATPVKKPFDVDRLLVVIEQID